MSANPEPRPIARERYTYRRRLSGRDLLPVLAVAVGAGLVAFYIARLLKQRAPLVDDARAGRAPRLRRSAGAAG
jgi:hypothetical protein